MVLHLHSSLTESIWSQYGPGIDSVSNRYVYHEYLLCRVTGKGGRCLELITLPPLRYSCPEILEVPAFRTAKGLSNSL